MSFHVLPGPGDALVHAPIALVLPLFKPPIHRDVCWEWGHASRERCVCGFTSKASAGMDFHTARARHVKASVAIAEPAVSAT